MREKSVTRQNFNIGGPKKALYLKCRKCSFNTLSLPLNMSLFAELQISPSYINRISRTPVFQQIIGIYIDGYVYDKNWACLNLGNRLRYRSGGPTVGKVIS